MTFDNTVFFFFDFLLFEIIYGTLRVLGVLARGRGRVRGRAMMMDDAVCSVFHLLATLLIKAPERANPCTTDWPWIYVWTGVTRGFGLGFIYFSVLFLLCM